MADVMVKLRAKALQESWEMRYPFPGDIAGDWRDRADCNDITEDLFFDPARTRQALAMCRECPVRLQCLQAGYADEQDRHDELVYGVIGGVTQARRRLILNTIRAAKRTNMHPLVALIQDAA